ncbi:MAG: hypothetical protein WBA61_13545 [Aequorivita sp.]
MFTTGQWVFAIIFFVAFIFIMIYSYRGDKKLHRKYYKGNLWILVGFILFVLFLIAVKMYFKN